MFSVRSSRSIRSSFPLTSLLACLSCGLLITACSGEPRQEQSEAPLDSGSVDAAEDIGDIGDASEISDTTDTAPLPDFACTEGFRTFPLEAPTIQTISALTQVAPKEVTAAPKLDPQLSALDLDREVDVLVYRRDERGNLTAQKHKVTVARAYELAAGGDVSFVAHRPPMVTTVDAQRRAVGTDAVQGFSVLDDGTNDEATGDETTNKVADYTGLTGEGVRVVVADSGVDDRHPDFHRWSPDGEDLGSRVTGPGPIDGSAHGTNVAGLIAGNGTDSEGRTVQDVTGTAFQFRGHAPKVTEIISVAMDSYAEELDTLVSAEGHVFNHSHTFSSGAYDERVAQYDGYIRTGLPSGPARPVVVASANNGHDSDYWWSRLKGYYSVLTPGKNTICVGSVHANDRHYAPTSSIGPTFDGRIKPDLVAPGHRDYRPLDGMDVSFEEIRLHATEESGAEDLVLRFDDGGLDNLDEASGWTAHGVFDAEPTDGVLSVRTVADRGDQFVLATDGINAADYEKLTFRMKLDVVSNPDNQHPEYRWPRFYVVRWDRDGDGRNDAHAYPRYDEDDKDGQWRTFEFTLSDKPRRWKNQMHKMTLRPVVYDDRVTSPKKEHGYGDSSGTSLAAPVVSGVVALMLEQFAVLHGVDLERETPRPSMIKALLIHTATDLFRDVAPLRDLLNPDTDAGVVYHRGPDFATGFGLVDANKAVDLIEAHTSAAPRFREETIHQGQIHTYRIPVAAGTPLRVTLAWDDVPGDFTSDQLEPKLVHDLDLVAVAPDGTGHSPWLLDPLPIDPDTYTQGVDPITSEDVMPARRCASADYWSGDPECVDRRNNVEQVIVDSPVDGFWEIRVRGFAVDRNQQQYSLVVTQSCQ